MEFSDFFSQQAFSLGGQSVQLGQLVAVLGGLLLISLLAYFLYAQWLNQFFERETVIQHQRRRIRRFVFISLVWLALLCITLGLGLDFSLHNEGLLARIKLSTLIQALLIFSVARLLDKFFSVVLTARYQKRRRQQIQEGIYQYQGRGSDIKVGRIVQPIVYVLAISFIVQELGVNYRIPAPWIKDAANYPTVNTFLSAALILLITRLVVWVVTEIFLYPYYRRREINAGSQYAINRLLSYFLLVIAIFAAIQYIGINLTLLWGGAAALLVGVGLGLQQTFNDLVSGIILLFERTVEIGDMVEVGVLIGTVRKIGVRTSLVETRDNISVIVPNSKLVGENVINWSHFDAKARFLVTVGVAYGSDTTLVKEILSSVVKRHKKVLDFPSPFVRFKNFGDSSLDFEIHFWSREFNQIEDVKSDLRFDIDQRFREANITIPFPQRDVWIRKEGDDSNT